MLYERAVSKSQQRYMALVASGKIKLPKGLTKKQATKFANTNHEDLPDRVSERLTFKHFLHTQ